MTRGLENGERKEGKGKPTGEVTFEGKKRGEFSDQKKRKVAAVGNKWLCSPLG